MSQRFDDNRRSVFNRLGKRRNTIPSNHDDTFGHAARTPYPTNDHHYTRSFRAEHYTNDQRSNYSHVHNSGTYDHQDNRSYYPGNLIITAPAQGGDRFVFSGSSSDQQVHTAPYYPADEQQPVVWTESQYPGQSITPIQLNPSFTNDIPLPTTTGYFSTPLSPATSSPPPNRGDTYIPDYSRLRQPKKPRKNEAPPPEQPKKRRVVTPTPSTPPPSLSPKAKAGVTKPVTQEEHCSSGESVISMDLDSDNLMLPDWGEDNDNEAKLQAIARKEHRQREAEEEQHRLRQQQEHRLQEKKQRQQEEEERKRKEQEEKRKEEELRQARWERFLRLEREEEERKEREEKARKQREEERKKREDEERRRKIQEARERIEREQERERLEKERQRTEEARLKREQEEADRKRREVGRLEAERKQREQEQQEAERRKQESERRRREREERHRIEKERQEAERKRQDREQQEVAERRRHAEEERQRQLEDERRQKEEEAQLLLQQQEKERVQQMLQAQQATAEVPVKQESDISAPQEHDDTEALPPGWEIHYSRSTSKSYFYNVTTGESTWERPRMESTQTPQSYQGAVAPETTPDPTFTQDSNTTIPVQVKPEPLCHAADVQPSTQLKSIETATPILSTSTGYPANKEEESSDLSPQTVPSNIIVAAAESRDPRIQAMKKIEQDKKESEFQQPVKLSLIQHRPCPRVPRPSESNKFTNSYRYPPLEHRPKPGKDGIPFRIGKKDSYVPNYRPSTSAVSRRRDQ